jgi:hypothetical protein
MLSNSKTIYFRILFYIHNLETVTEFFSKNKIFFPIVSKTYFKFLLNLAFVELILFE